MRVGKAALGGLALAGAVVAGLAATGHLPASLQSKLSSAQPHARTEVAHKPEVALPIAVTAVRAHQSQFVETALVTGTLVPREEIIVGPEVEGLRVVDVLADEGDRVRKGQVLARLVSDTLEAQLAQNDAALARATAAIAQARATIASAEARLTEARNAYSRGMPLAKTGVISESGMDQREASAKTSEAAVVSARQGLTLAEAEKNQIEAQRRELVWRRGRTDITAPADGVVSRRNVRIGGFATGAGEPMFRIIARGEIELEGEASELQLPRIREGQPAVVSTAGADMVKGRVRLVSPEIDRNTRLGRLRIFLGDVAGLRIGAFARGRIETARSDGLAIPASAVLYGSDGPTVQLVVDGLVRTRRIKLGLAQGDLVEVREGLAPGDVVVARSGTFLRDGDAVRPVVEGTARVTNAG